MFLSGQLKNQMADALLDYTAKIPRHLSDMSGYLQREFELPGELSDREFEIVRAKAKDRGQLREPAVAFMPMKRNGETFRGWWTTQPVEENAVAHALLQIKQVATRAARDGRNYRLVLKTDPELGELCKSIRILEVTCQRIIDDERGVLRSNAERDQQLAEMVRLVASLNPEGE